MGQRTGVEELNHFVQAIIQSEQLGSGVSRILRIQSDEMRVKRLVTAQERGARASLKMLFPMLGCIFPTLWVILLGPAAILAMRLLRAGLRGICSHSARCFVVVASSSKPRCSRVYRVWSGYRAAGRRRCQSVTC